MITILKFLILFALTFSALKADYLLDELELTDESSSDTEIVLSDEDFDDISLDDEEDKKEETAESSSEDLDKEYEDFINENDEIPDLLAEDDFEKEDAKEEYKNEIAELLEEDDINDRDGLNERFFLSEEELPGGSTLRSRKRRKSFVGYKKFRALIKKSSVLVDINNLDRYKINRDMYSYVKHVDYHSGRFYVLDKKGEPRYYTHVGNLVRINDVTTLFPKNQQVKNYSRRQKKQKLITEEIDDFTLTSKFLLLLNNTNSTFYSNYYDIDESRAAGLKLEYRAYYKWDFPLVYGILINSGRNYVIEDFQSSKLYWDNINLGTVIRFPYYENDTAIFFLEFHVQKSIYGVAELDDPIDTSESSIGIDFDFSFPVHKNSTKNFINLGTSFRFTKTSVKDGPTTFSIPPNSNNNFEIGLYLGFMADAVF